MMGKHPHVTVVGSINMDLVVRCRQLPTRGETILAESASEIPGGKGANQAVAAARAGGEVQMVGRVGDDAFSKRLIGALNQENVGTENVYRTSDCSSGVAIVAVESSGQNSIMVVPGANGHVTASDIQNSAEAIRSANILLVQLEIPIESVHAAIEIANQVGVRVILDPAPIPNVLPIELLEVDLICPNQTEAAAIVGKPIDSVDDARDAIPAMHRRGAKSVAITLGDQGAVVSNGESIEWIRPIPVMAIDSTAAGDAFAGALAVRLGEGANVFDASRFASAAGAIAATRAGAQVGMPRRDEIEQILV
jgi:ribokinase